MPSTLDFIRDVSTADSMLRPDTTEPYFNVGLDALRIVQGALRSTGLGRPTRILDLACGHGRVLRMLRAAYPEASITACDTDRRGVEFCARTFDVEGVVVSPDPAQVDLPGQYDLVWCGSLLTHLPARTWQALFALFQRELEPGGVLVFTTHGRKMAELLQAGRVRFAVEPSGLRALCERYEEDGFAFEPYTSSRDGGYGVSLASESWVLSALERVPGLELVSYGEAEWDGRQDAVVCRARIRPSRTS